MKRRRLEGFDIAVDVATSLRMGGVRQKGTAPELAVRRALRALGIRYRLKNRDLPGSPDIANRRRRFAVFVHGCFWHRHQGCRATTTPNRNREFWLAKFDRNVQRDREVQELLRRRGFRVVVVWECETKKDRGTLVHKLKRAFAPD